MALRLYDSGADDILSTYFGTRTRQSTYKVCLYTSPAGALTTDATLEEATGGGYTRHTFTPDDVEAVLGAAGGGVDEYAWDDITFTFTGALTNATNKTVQGYALIKGNASTPWAASDVIFAENISAFIPGTDDTLTVRLHFKMGNGTPT